MVEQTYYPSWVCRECGDAHSRLGGMPMGHAATYHMDNCGICGGWKAVTEPRDFGHLVIPEGGFQMPLMEERGDATVEAITASLGIDEENVVH